MKIARSSVRLCQVEAPISAAVEFLGREDTLPPERH